MKLDRRALLKGSMALAFTAGQARAQTEWAGDFDTGNAVMGTHWSEDPLLSPQTLQFTRQAATAYADLATRGGWPWTAWEANFSLGTTHPQVALLRQRLVMENDLDARYANGTTFDSFVDAAVRRFQVRHGLTVDGAAGPATLATMNVSADEKARLLQTNVPRIDDEIAAEGRYVAVNIPSAELELVENGRVVARHPTVVGQKSRATPILTSAIYEVNFNPYWTVPNSIIRKDLIPTIRRDPGYLDRMSMRIFDHSWNEVSPQTIDWSGEDAARYIFRQDPGANNALGRVRINFQNDHAVYLHDTPQPGLFGDASRFHSSGCIRVQNIPQFVAWLLSETPDWSLSRVQEMLGNAERRDVKLAREIPVHFVYITAWSAPDLTTSFREDVYGIL